ncbi:GGDEF domain-containing protein [Thermincola potens]|uniref:Diguanylate cyclase/phosphodiesterase n=1 Tax=Thermincola potens (strain JR) TaxID=635013 RepID=D5XA31_THEPJ|nr:GGDEF domain-containing protein [Thermincola potens]ADG83164.1 diguanylate cyclase/phosphodiesterase [Thermincola potens JR]
MEGMVNVSETKRKDCSNNPQFRRKELENIIRERKIRIVYQPIVNVKTGEIMGYEALTRGPEGSPLFSPVDLFQAAMDNQLLFALEQICREEALNNIQDLKSYQQLFLNMNAEVVNDPHFQNGKTKKCVTLRGFKPEQVTFEITERTAITDFDSFCRSLCHYREQGYTIAVDDAGAGYSSLQAIVELRPEYIKLDMSIIRGIHTSLPKQAIVEAMVKLAAAVNAKIIAEGVETREELIALYNLGVHYVQGYYLARPSYPAPEITPEAMRLIANLNNTSKRLKQNNQFIGLGIRIGEIAELTQTIEKETPVSKVEQILHEKNLNGLVVVENGQPIGLVMKNKLYYRLGTSYGVSLYQNRPVALIMDKSPLIVHADMPLEDASQIAMSRDEYNLYDLIIVVDKGGKYAGVVSIMSMLNNITKIRISCAQNSNPLTGLPGNLIIEAKLKALVEENGDFTVLYADLDNFKAFNDKYGFENGDKAILLTAQILSDSLVRFGSGDDFVGHIGGDDFVIITKPEYAKNIANYILENFDKNIRNLYDPKDLALGFIEVTNRRGRPEKFPIMSISLAAVNNTKRKFRNYLEIGEIAAELKRVAKQNQGSSVVFDF